MTNCPSQEQLFQYAEGDITQELKSEIEQHIANCPECQAAYGQIPEPKLKIESITPLPGGDTEHSNEEKNSDQSPIKQVGDFRLLKEIGRGGMGIVYLAEQISLNRRVALKTLPQLQVLDKNVLNRFQREARAAAYLKHRNIVPVYLLGEEETHFYVMSFIEGLTLAEVIRDLRQTWKFSSGDHSLHSGIATKFLFSTEGQKATATTIYAKSDEIESNPSGVTELATSPSSNDDNLSSEFFDLEYFKNVARMGIQAAEALDYAHSEGIIHRDIKPSNLMVDDNMHLWVTDFGLAWIESEASQSLSADRIVGTLRYMSPEQALGDRSLIDSRTDIYSLGATLYELCTLKTPFSDVQKSQLISVLNSDEPKKPRQLQPEVPKDLETIILKAMSKEAHERYDTAGKMAEDLRCFLENRPISAKPPALTDRLQKWVRRNRLVAALAFTVMASLTSLAIFLAIYNSQITKVNKELGDTITSLEKSQSKLRETVSTLKVRERDHRQRLYASDMQAAMQDKRRIPELLDQYLPAEGEEDLRSIEWHYLKRHTETELDTIAKYDGQFYAMTLSPNGSQLALGGNDSRLRVIDLNSKSELCSIDTEQIEINSIAYSPDGNHIATFGHEGRVRIWKNHEFTEVISFQATNFQGLDKFVRGLDVIFSPDGQLLLTASQEEFVGIWDWKSGELIRKLSAPSGGSHKTPGINKLKMVSASHTLAAACNDGQLRIWNTENWEQKQVIWYGVDRLLCVDITSDGTKVATAGARGKVSIWDIESGKSLLLHQHTQDIYSAKFSNNGHFFALGDLEGGVTIWPLNSIFSKGKSRDEIEPPIEFLNWPIHTSRITEIQFKDNNTLYTCSWDGEVKLWKPFKNLPHKSIVPKQKNINDFAQLSESEYFLTVSENGDLELWNAVDEKYEALLYHHHLPLSVVNISDNHRWLTIADNSETIFKWDLSSPSPPEKIQCYLSKNFQSKHLDFSHDSKLLAYQQSPHNVSVIDLETGKAINDFSDSRHPVFSPDGKHLALINAPADLEGDLSWGDAVDLKEIKTGQLIHSFEEPNGVCNQIQFNKDGSELITANSERQIHFWDYNTFELKKTLNPGKIGRMTTLAQTTEGSTILIGNRGRQLSFWQAETGLELFSLPRQTSAVYEIAFTMDGRKIVLRKENKKLNVIDTLSPEEYKNIKRTKPPAVLLKPLTKPQ